MAGLSQTVLKNTSQRKPDVLEEYIASIQMEAAYSSKTSSFIQTTWYYSPENCTL
jgi:hypothetical protein